MSLCQGRRGNTDGVALQKSLLRPLTRDDKDCEKLIQYSVLVENILEEETGQKRLLGDFLY